MPSAKQEIITMIKRMPNSASTPDIMAGLYFRAKVDRGLTDAKEGKTVSNEKTKKDFKKWLKLK